MKKINYANILKEILGDELYYKLIKELAKENNGMDIVIFGKEALDKLCFLILTIGTSKKINLDIVKICTSDEILEISCKEFANKYKEYTKKIEENVFNTIKNMQ